MDLEIMRQVYAQMGDELATLQQNIHDKRKKHNQFGIKLCVEAACKYGHALCSHDFLTQYEDTIIPDNIEQIPAYIFIPVKGIINGNNAYDKNATFYCYKKDVMKTLKFMTSYIANGDKIIARDVMPDQCDHYIADYNQQINTLKNSDARIDSVYGLHDYISSWDDMDIDEYNSVEIQFFQKNMHIKLSHAVLCCILLKKVT